MVFSFNREGEGSTVPYSEKFMATLKQRRAKLIAALGGKCYMCESKIDLEFDHIHGRNWTPREVAHSKRMTIYEEEASRGLLRLLCKVHNGGYRPEFYEKKLNPKVLRAIDILRLTAV